MKGVKVARIHQLPKGESQKRDQATTNNFVLETIDIPAPSENEVIVKVGACGVCYRDLIDRTGGFKGLPLPRILGHEFSGTIVSVGKVSDSKFIKKWSAGTRVANIHTAPCGNCEFCNSGNAPRCQVHDTYYGLATDGGYAQYVLCHNNSLVQIPDGIEDTEACFLHCTAAVAYRGLKAQGQLKQGQRVLITGASGGVGLHALQLAKIMGASHVICITSNSQKVPLLKEYGADEVIVDRDGQFYKQISDLVDVVLDLVGAPTFNASLRSLLPRGRLILIGNVTASDIKVNPGQLILKEITISGSGGATPDDLAYMFELVKSKKLKPVLEKILPLEDAYKAHEMLRKREVSGRIVLQPFSKL